MRLGSWFGRWARAAMSALEARIVAAIVGAVLAGGELLVVATFRGCVTRWVRYWMRRAGWLVEGRVGYAAFQARGFRFRGAMLALVGLFLFLLACAPGAGWS